MDVVIVSLLLNLNNLLPEIEVFKSSVYTSHYPIYSYYNLSQYPDGDYSTHRAKCQIFGNFPGLT